MRRACVLLVILASACGRGGESRSLPSPPPPSELQGGVLATFDVAGETFRVFVTNPATIDEIFALQDGSSAANIPNGAIHAGPGIGAHNAPWSWHLDPEDIEMGEVTAEVHDGGPSIVEGALSEYLKVGRYCPWGAQLVGVQDFRSGRKAAELPSSAGALSCGADLR